MSFTSFDYAVFLVAVFVLFWATPWRPVRNAILLVSSYVFYGWVHPWFCLLIASSTIVDYLCGLGMAARPRHRRRFLLLSLTSNLGLLAAFKYFGFFADNLRTVLEAVGFQPGAMTLEVYLPVGISFYTFQTLSYTIDVFRGKLAPRRDFIDFATFVALFPQLVAGPIERAANLLPQLERRLRLSQGMIAAAWPLIVRGLLKKLVVADNMAVYADQIFALDTPGPALLFAGTAAFTLQIYGDFSGYTDIARGSARLFGIDLMENFRSPYMAVTPSDFWRRWHISLSSWINDYLYVPLGGSRVRGRLRFFFVLIVTMGLSGLWHGAAWNFVAWGVFHAMLLFVYHALGKAGRWTPSSVPSRLAHVGSMFCFTFIGWMLFRAPSLGWLGRSLASGTNDADSLIVAGAILALVSVYGAGMLALGSFDRWVRDRSTLRHAAYGLGLCVLMLLARSGDRDFIYFRF